MNDYYAEEVEAAADRADYLYAHTDEVLSAMRARGLACRYAPTGRSIPSTYALIRVDHPGPALVAVNDKDYIVTSGSHEKRGVWSTTDRPSPAQKAVLLDLAVAHTAAMNTQTAPQERPL